MMNSSSMKNFYMNNQNYDPNIFPISSNITNYNYNSKNVQNINIIYPKNILQKKNSVKVLTAQNNQPKQLIPSSSSVSKINTTNALFNTSLNSNIFNNINSINKNIPSKINNKGMNRYYSSDNIHILNLPNIGIIKEDKNNIHIIESKANNEVIHCKANYKPLPKKNKNKISKIPHPIFKRKLLPQNNIHLNLSNYNNNFNTYNNNQLFYSETNLNEYNSSNLVTDNTVNYLTNNDFSTSVNNIFGIDNYNSIFIEEEPSPDFKLSDFIILNQIGHGAEGIINAVKWIKNDKIYALKKCEIIFEDTAKKKKKDISKIKEILDSTGNDGIIKIYGTLLKNNEFATYYLYELMEYAEKDWEKEIINRQQKQLFYQEYELLEIFRNLVKTFSLLQSRHITHRDVKPQNIMLVKGKYKICDFGNARILEREGIIVQKIRGSEMFMSPIVFKGYHSGCQTIKHNTYKSDVFSLGMCFFFAAALNYGGLNIIREIYDVNIIRKVLNDYLAKRYSQNVINLIFLMLQVDENRRPDFFELELLLP